MTETRKSPSKKANMSGHCEFPSLVQMMQMNANYYLVEYTMVGVIFKSLLAEKVLDLWVSLVAFVGEILIHKANLIPLRLKCAPSAWTLNTTPPSQQESGHPYA